MKKIFIYCAALTVVLSACKKDKQSQPETNGKLYPVNFDISNFSQQIEPLTQSKVKTNAVVSPDKAGILKLMYKVYDANSVLLKTKIVRKKGSAPLPSVKDSLAAGNYTGVFVGIADTLEFQDQGKAFQYIRDKFPFFVETYYQKIGFTVGASNFHQDVTLSRLNAEIQIVLKDAIPAGIKSIDVSFQDYRLFQYFENAPLSIPSPPFFDVLYTNFNSTSIPSSAIGTTNFALTPQVVFNTVDPVTIMLWASDGKSLYVKNITGVRLQRNTRTILTGNFFTNDLSDNGFHVTFQSLNPNDLTQGF